MSTERFDADGELARIAELRRLRILQTGSSPDLDDLVTTAAALFDVPIALISLIDGSRQWIKASVGFAEREMSRDVALCNHAIASPDQVFLVPDAEIDPRFARNPLVTGDPMIRFYAGAPLVSSRGFALGALCVIDRRPREFRHEQLRALTTLAAFAMRIFERDCDVSLSASLQLITTRPPLGGVAVFSWDENAHVIRWNSAASAVLGWPEHEVLGRFPPFIYATDHASFRNDCRAVLSGAADIARLCTIEAKGGRCVNAVVGLTREVDAGGALSVVSTFQLLGAQVETERRCSLLESVVVNSSDAVVVLSAESLDGLSHRIVYVNDAFTRMTGYSPVDAIGKTLGMLEGPATDKTVMRRVFEALQRDEAVSAEVLEYRRDGSEFWVDFSISPVKDVDGCCMYFVAIERETTSRRALETYEQNRARVLEMAVRNAPLDLQFARIVMLLKSVIPGSTGTVMLLQGDRLVLAAADPALSAEYIGAINGARIGPDAGSCGTAVYFREAVISGDIESDARWHAYADVARTAGLRACWSIPFFAADGDVVGAFALYADQPAVPTAHQLQLFEETARFAALVVDRHRDRQHLERMALYDGLTGLPNRKLVEAALVDAMVRAQESGRLVALGVLDIDRFKAINDAFGHHVGDQLLRRIADRLGVSLGEGGALGRMAGDEFIVVLPDLTDSSEGVDAATRLLNEFNTAFVVEEYEIVVRPSLGIAFFPVTSADKLGLFQAADKAMYAAKLRGGGVEVAVSPHGASAVRLLNLEKDFRFALERNELELYYQMIFDLTDGRAIGAEALLRWNHPQLGLIGPSEFIPLAEANGTIVAVGTWVIEQAARAARQWQDAGSTAFVTVNVSALQFDAPGLVATVTQALERYRLEPRRLHLELTESLVMRNPGASAATLVQLKALGVQIVIDDFGTGYSSLAYLQRFSFDTLKVDRAFVRGIGHEAMSERSEHIVAAVVQLSVALGVTTVAEGVENAAQYAFVRSCGCTAVQGFFCAYPEPKSALVWQPTGAPPVQLNLEQTF